MGSAAITILSRRFTVGSTAEKPWSVARVLADTTSGTPSHRCLDVPRDIDSRERVLAGSLGNSENDYAKDCSGSVYSVGVRLRRRNPGCVAHTGSGDASTRGLGPSRWAGGAILLQHVQPQFNHIRDLESFTDYKEGKAGAPIKTLSHQMDAGTILTSEATDFVGAHITGYLRLDTTGTYRFQITNNDGVRFHLGGARIHDDPGTGPARTSAPIPIDVTEKGWYALEIWYFEKRGTATLEVLWSPPGESAMTNLPADAMKH
jgi:hypothetical protein